MASAHMQQEYHFIGATKNFKKRKRNQPHQVRPAPSHNTSGFHNGNDNNSNGNTLRDLTPGEQHFVERQMQKGGGGTQFFDRVQQTAGWRARARDLKLCFKCAAPQHPRNVCPAKPPPQRNVSSLNSLTLFDEDTLWLFPYFIANLQGIALPDTGATRIYISRTFAL